MLWGGMGLDPLLNMRSCFYPSTREEKPKLVLLLPSSHSFFSITFLPTVPSGQNMGLKMDIFYPSSHPDL